MHARTHFPRNISSDVGALGRVQCGRGVAGGRDSI